MVDNFIEVTSGLMFFVIPWGFIFYFTLHFLSLFQQRYICFGLSITLLTILGTGTTPIPLMVKNAFNILTLDRFTYGHLS
jgi:hypothetical protein